MRSDDLPGRPPMRPPLPPPPEEEEVVEVVELEGRGNTPPLSCACTKGVGAKEEAGLPWGEDTGCAGLCPRRKHPARLQCDEGECRCVCRGAA